MTPIEASTLIDFAIAAGQWRDADSDLKQDQIAAWSMILSEVPYAFAEAEVRNYSGAYGIQPSQIRGAWENRQREARRHKSYDERACGAADWCRCAHAENICYQGWIDSWLQKPLRATPPEKIRCLSCFDALNSRRIEKGDEPLLVPPDALHPLRLPSEHTRPSLADLRFNDGSLTPYGEFWLMENDDPYPEGVRPNAASGFDRRVFDEGVWLRACMDGNQKHVLNERLAAMFKKAS